MDGKTDSLANARIMHIRRISRDQSTRDLNTSYFERCELDEAVREIRNTSNQKVKDRVIRKVVDSRNNKSIKNLLTRTKIDRETTDQVDSCTTTCDQTTFESAVLFATLNNDPETLEAILDWGVNNIGKKTYLDMENMDESRTLSPILIASLENYSGCLPLLFKHGYRIDLPKEDESKIDNMLSLDQHSASSLHFYYNINKVNYKENHSDLGIRFRKMHNKKKRLDPVEYYLKFRGHANPLYLSVSFTSQEEVLLDDGIKLEHLDPIRKVFVLSRYTKYLQDCFPEHAVQYKEIRGHCQNFAKNVLEQCNSSRDVCTLLEYCPEEIRHRRENTNWQLAIWEEHKGFVSHPFFQHYIWAKMVGNRLDWDSYFFIQKILMLPFAVILFMSYPFIVVFDSIFLDGNLLFVSPEELKENSTEELQRNSDVVEEEGQGEDDSEDENPSENAIMNFFRVRIHRPVFRMFVYGFFEFFFLFCLFLTIKDPNDKPGIMDFSWYDVITCYFILNYLIEDLINIGRWNWNFFTSFWKMYSLVNHLILFTGGIIAWQGFASETNDDNESGDDNRTHFGGNHAINVGMTLVSYGASMSFFRTVHWLLLHRCIGPVLLCIIRVMQDVIYICFIAGIAYLSFAVGLWSMYKPFQMSDVILYHNRTKYNYTINEEKLTDNSGWRGLFSLMFWTIFDGEYSDAQVIRSNADGEKSFSLEFSHVMGVSMWAIYQGLTVILLINILIALMNSRYTKVWENADMEWKYSKAYYQIQFHHPRAVFPPPFCWIYYFAKFIWWLKKEKKSEKPRNNKKYLNLLLKLVKNKMHIDMETSIQGDFNDLRKDIRNMVNSKGKGDCEDCLGKQEKIKRLEKEIQELREGQTNK